MISEGYKNISMAPYSPMWNYHRRVAMKALRYVNVSHFSLSKFTHEHHTFERYYDIFVLCM